MHGCDLPINTIQWRIITGVYPRCFRKEFDLRKPHCWKNSCGVEEDCWGAWLLLYAKRLKWLMKIDRAIKK